MFQASSFPPLHQRLQTIQSFQNAPFSLPEFTDQLQNTFLAPQLGKVKSSTFAVEKRL
jgi:hypothetical protein